MNYQWSSIELAAEITEEFQRNSAEILVAFPMDFQSNSWRNLRGISSGNPEGFPEDFQGNSWKKSIEISKGILG